MKPTYTIIYKPNGTKVYASEERHRIRMLRLKIEALRQVLYNKNRWEHVLN